MLKIKRKDTSARTNDGIISKEAYLVEDEAYNRGLVFVVPDDDDSKIVFPGGERVSKKIFLLGEYNDFIQKTFINRISKYRL